MLFWFLGAALTAPVLYLLFSWGADGRRRARQVSLVAANRIRSPYGPGVRGRISLDADAIL